MTLVLAPGHRLLVFVAAASVALYSATIKGTIIDPSTYPLAQAVVWAATGDCLQSRRAVPDSQGHYSIDHLLPGVYQLFATHPGFWCGERPVRLNSGTTAVVDMQLQISDADTGGAPPSMPLSGVITDADDRALSGARVIHSGRGHEHLRRL
jgi:carboxypeptidase family protein